MNVDITNRVLPGIGVCQEIDLRDGHRIGIVTRRNGLRDLIFYDEEGDGAALTVALSEDEANAIAELLGAPALTFRLAVLQRQAEGLIVEQLPVPADSPYAAAHSATPRPGPAPARPSWRCSGTARRYRRRRRTSCCSPAISS